MRRADQRRVRSVLLLAAQIRCCTAAGGASLWELGELVDNNPYTVFSMFCFTIVLVLAIEFLKHKADHSTKDGHRKRALESIYSELMIMGVVAFALILSAELGLTKAEFRKPWCDPDEYTGSNSGKVTAGGSAAAEDLTDSPVDSGSTASGSAASSAAAGSNASAAVTDCGGNGGSGSGSGLGPCYVQFDLLIFEYAHLVLFFMGLTYACFIQVAFYHKDRLCNGIERIQRQTLQSWLNEGPDGRPTYVEASVLGVMGLKPKSSSRQGKKSAWARGILMLRLAMCVHLKEQLEDACDPREHILEEMIASVRGQEAPAPRADPKEVQTRFDIARFTRIAMSEVLVELIHVPYIVWGVVIFMSGANLLGAAGVDLAGAVLIFSALIPACSVVLLWRMSAHLLTICAGAAGHPEIQGLEYFKAEGPSGSFAVDPSLEHPGARWHEHPEKHPWHKLDGCIPDDHCCDWIDPLDARNIEKEIQAIVFASCYSVGQLVMLTNLIQDHMGVLVLALCWATPLISLFFLVPRALLIYTLTHRTAAPPRAWLVYAVKERNDPPPPDHGHGHGGGGHGHGGDGHGHGGKGNGAEAHGGSGRMPVQAELQRMWRLLYPAEPERDLLKARPPRRRLSGDPGLGELKSPLIPGDNTPRGTPFNGTLGHAPTPSGLGSVTEWHAQDGHAGPEIRSYLRAKLKRTVAATYEDVSEQQMTRLDAALDAFIMAADKVGTNSFGGPRGGGAPAFHTYTAARSPRRRPEHGVTVAFGRPSGARRPLPRELEPALTNTLGSFRGPSGTGRGGPSPPSRASSRAPSVADRRESLEDDVSKV
eukprot:TRINITY_DN36374_c0_g1_i1.p1 TRINITY_DN36374_c0_g1~~TRINITY_DN36374_c0_g1_i1.p1  ORF type:complete len:857 (+),score=175.73 TRINITY_DN36374_c0_g1_i1:112-2571(+)